MRGDHRTGGTCLTLKLTLIESKCNVNRIEVS